jgi:hypothetical protein
MKNNTFSIRKGAGRQSSRQAQRRIIDQIMIITASNENHSNGHQFCKDIETNSISEDGSSCTGRIYFHSV